MRAARVPVPHVQVSIDMPALLIPQEVSVVQRAVEAQMSVIAEYARGVWVQYAQEIGPNRTGAYLAGIRDFAETSIDVHASDVDVTGTITISNTAEHAAIVEDGHAAFRLPDAIDWGSGSGAIKHGANGPYLSIPFGHNAPVKAGGGATESSMRAQMPSEIYRRAVRLQSRTRTNSGRQYDASGHYIAADRYRWSQPDRQGGRRLTDKQLGITGPGSIAGAGGITQAWRDQQGIAGRINGRQASNPAWGSSRFAGLFKTGPKGHSSYLTIRVVTPHSPGWNIPAQRGYGILRAVAATISSGIHGEELGRILIAAARDAILGVET